MKKFLSLILALALVLSLGAAQAEQKVYRIGCSLFSFSDNFQSLYRAELERYIASLETDEVRYELILADVKPVENYYRVDYVKIDRDHLE